MRHDQRPDKRMMQCKLCKNNDCAGCIDVPLLKMGRSVMCTCTRNDHTKKVNDAVQPVSNADSA